VLKRRLTLIAATVLVGSFVAAGHANGLWKTPEVRSHSFEGFLTAFGLPYGQSKAHHPVRLQAMNAGVGPSQIASLDHASLTVQTDDGSAASHADSSARAKSPATADGVVPADAAADRDLVDFVLPAEPADHADEIRMGQELAAADAAASRSVREELTAAAAGARDQAAKAKVSLIDDADRLESMVDLAELEREAAEAAHMLSFNRALAAQIDQGDFSRFVLNDTDQTRCGTLGLSATCKPLSVDDIARIRADVARDVQTAQADLHAAQGKLVKMRQASKKAMPVRLGTKPVRVKMTQSQLRP
jgi:hypothetical protein